MVRAGLGVAMLPRLWTELLPSQELELVPLDGIVPPRVIVLAWRSDRTLTPVQQLFVDAVAAACSPPRLQRIAS
jgi:DNA-binding transcriptional LysR family regulator